MADNELIRLLEALRQETTAGFATTTETLRQENAAAHAETRSVLRQENAAAHAETRRLAEALSEQTRRHFEVYMERLEKRFDLLAESVEMVNEKVERAAISNENSAAETQAMIKFSHDELRRRVSVLEGTQRTVEQTLADMQARLERLEGSLR